MVRFNTSYIKAYGPTPWVLEVVCEEARDEYRFATPEDVKAALDRIRWELKDLSRKANRQNKGIKN